MTSSSRGTLAAIRFTDHSSRWRYSSFATRTRSRSRSRNTIVASTASSASTTTRTIIAPIRPCLSIVHGRPAAGEADAAALRSGSSLGRPWDLAVAVDLLLARFALGIAARQQHQRPHHHHDPDPLHVACRPFFFAFGTSCPRAISASLTSSLTRSARVMSRPRVAFSTASSLSKAARCQGSQRMLKVSLNCFLFDGMCRRCHELHRHSSSPWPEVHCT